MSASDVVVAAVLMIAAAAMALSSLSVVTNANRLRHTRITPTSKGSNT